MCVETINMDDSLLSLIQGCHGCEIDSLFPVISVITNPAGVLNVTPLEAKSLSFELTCMEGGVSLLVGDISYHLCKGQDLVLAGGSLSKLEFSNDFRGYFLVMTNRYCDTISSHDYYAVKTYYTIPVVHDLKRYKDNRHFLFYELLKCIIRSRPCNAEELILYYLKTMFRIFADHNKLKASVSTCRNSLIAKRFFELLEKSKISQVSDSFLSEQIGISQRSLVYAIKSVTGMAPSEHVMRCKVAKAKEMIKVMDVGTAFVSISDALGFSSMSSFSRFFRAQTGQTPSEYRNSLNSV